RVLMPAYNSVPDRTASPFFHMPATAHFPAARLLSATLPNDVPALLVDTPPDRVGLHHRLPNSSGYLTNIVRHPY
ncbi:MAG: hypothetical protein ACXWEI_16000, partial [Mycobacterium sp.]